MYVTVVKNDLEHFAFKISLTPLISTRLIDQLASRGSIPTMAILTELYLDWIACVISIIPFAISSGESWNKLFFQYKIMIFLRLDMTRRFWARYKKFWTLSPPIPQFIKVFRGSRYFVQTRWYQFNPAAIESLIIIVLKRFFVKLEQR